MLHIPCLGGLTNKIKELKTIPKVYNQSLMLAANEEGNSKQMLIYSVQFITRTARAKLAVKNTFPIVTNPSDQRYGHQT